MVGNDKQTEFASCLDMCNFIAEKISRNGCEFDSISFEVKCHVGHE